MTVADATLYTYGKNEYLNDNSSLAYKPLILYVEDDQIMQIMLSRMLTQAGYEVVAVSSGKEAMRFTDNVTPSLILLDMVMPDMDGYEVAEQLQDNEKTAFIPLIFVTANTQEDNIKYFSAGVVDHINKPFNKESLVTKVKAHLSTSQRWQNIHRDINFYNEISPNLSATPGMVFADSANNLFDFELCKKHLARIYHLSDRDSIRLLLVEPENIYSFFETIGISNQELSISIALFLKLPYVAKIDTDRLRLGVLPVPFCRSKQVLATKDAAGNNVMVVNNPFDREMIDILQKNFDQVDQFVITTAKTINTLCS